MKKENSTCGCNTAITAKYLCPTCQKVGTSISATTLKAQVQKKNFLALQNAHEDFNFCTTSSCNTVYYANDGSEVLRQEEVKNRIALKDEDLKTPLCYCKKLLKQDVLTMIQNNEKDIAEKIKAIVSKGKAVCEKANPRGVCCTEDITNFLAEHGLTYMQNSALATKESTCCDSSANASYKEQDLTQCNSQTNCAC